ncbi:MAG: terminase small subunit [Proteobacteria bacterium]|jgi:hypothetical protein|nr:terminase small subunit [Pseudomonadota bacterium]
MAKTNPNGANQYVLDPRQKMCWDLYIKPGTEYFGNGLQSAIKAGYDKEYAAQITTAEWFLEKLRRLGMLGKAERVLDKALTYSTENDEGKVITDLLRIQTDVAKHITKTLGKDEGYSERSEVEQTGEVTIKIERFTSGD